MHRVLTEYLRHYNTVRPHRGLDLQPPRPAARLTLVEPGTGESSVQRVDVLGGLIHEHRRAALIWLSTVTGLVRFHVPGRGDRRTP